MNSNLNSRWRSWLTIGAVSGASAVGILGGGMPDALAREPIPEARLRIRVELKSATAADVVVVNDEAEPAKIDLSRIAHLKPVGVGLTEEVDSSAAALGLTPPIHSIQPIHLGVPSHQEARSEFPIEAMANGYTVVDFQSRVSLGNGRSKIGPTFYQVYQITNGVFKPVSYEDAFLARRVSVLKPGQQSRAASLKLGGGYVAQVEVAKLAFNAHELSAAQIAQIQPVRLPAAFDMADKFALKQMPAVGARQLVGGVVTPHPTYTPPVPHPTFTPIPHPTFTPQPNPTFHPVPGPGPIHGGPGVTGFGDEFVDSSERPLAGFAFNEQGEQQGDTAFETMDVGTFSGFTIKGHMSTKYDDGSFHAAWGWVVTAWQNQQIGPVSIFMPLGWAYVNGDGSWAIPMGNAQAGRQVYVQYQTANRFVQLQDPSGNVYTWGDWWNLNGATTDIGYRFADLSASGDLPGIDKLYEGATEEWSKFYYNGMNALRDKPIEVTYPNTLASGHCSETKDGAGNTVPKYAWSCSEWNDGKIWIIAAHGDKSVVQHEAAHSINSYYWGGTMSSGAGGAHSLDGCYNGGLALTEGFANFVAYWTQFDRGVTSATASYFGEDIESYAGDNSCSSGEINEMRVAATFWDMYDTPNDGPDNDHKDGWFYTDQASPISLYLNNGTQQKMSDYLSIVDAGDANWYAADRALFRLNKIIK